MMRISVLFFAVVCNIFSLCSSVTAGEYGPFGSSSLVSEARRYIGQKPPGMGSLWCARFMNMLLARAGYKTSGSNMAMSFAGYGHSTHEVSEGMIVYMHGRGRGRGHVGIVSGVEPNGKIKIISGNWNNRVAEATISRRAILGAVSPQFTSGY